MGIAPLYSAAIILAAASIPPAANDPLAPARSGQIQCYTPDTARKLCASLSRYTWSAKQDILNIAEVLVSENPPIAMRTTSPVVMKSGAVCGPIRAQDLGAADIFVSGRLASPQATQEIRSKLPAMFANFLNKEVCTTYVVNQAGFTAQVTIDGVAHPEMAQRVIWVKPNDGYTVGH